MTDAQMPIDQTEQEISRLKLLIFECEKRMAVHPTQLDDRKKGEYCPNRRARMQHQRHRDELVWQVAELESKKDETLAPVEAPVQQANTDLKDHAADDPVADV